MAKKITWWQAADQPYINDAPVSRSGKMTFTTFPKLLQRPFRGWMTRCVEMQNPAAADFHDDEHINQPARCGDDDEEVTRDDRLRMIPHECHPSWELIPGYFGSVGI